MKLVSISGIILRVSNPKASAEFYERLGFLVIKKEEDVCAIRLNWFWVEFVKASSSHPVLPSSQFVYVSVDDVDNVYQDLKVKGVKFADGPKDYPSGRREAMLKDPDGYWIVFFQKK